MLRKNRMTIKGNLTYLLFYKKSSARARFLPRDSSCCADGGSSILAQKYFACTARCSSGEKLGSLTLRSVGFLNSALVCMTEPLGRVRMGCRTRSSGRVASGLPWDWEAEGAGGAGGC